MPKTNIIPVNYFDDESNTGISIERIALKDLPVFEKLEKAERHNWHSFHLLEQGSITIEIDFKKHTIQSPSVVYMHPNQVHRIRTFRNFTVTSWAINPENLNPEYLKLLDDITPATPLSLQNDTFSLLSEALAICLKFAQRKNDRLYHLSLKDSCNALIALVISLYLEETKPNDKLSRSESITKAFKTALERNFVSLKKPAAYAQALHISTPYLNECVKTTTGHPVSYHIQQRVILEAKRLLHHSDQSVKEIAAALGYDDYPYFSRLFTKVTDMSPLSFRNKNRD